MARRAFREIDRDLRSPSGGRFAGPAPARGVALGILAAVLPFLVGCTDLAVVLFGVGSSESRPYPGRTAGEVWDALQDAVNETYNIKRADDEDLHLITEWSEHLAPMYKLGRRYQVEAWVRSHEETGAPYIEIAVVRELNTNMDRPLIASEADWEYDARDELRERNIIQLVNLKFHEIKPSKEALEAKPSSYRRDPAEKAREDLWGDGEGKGPGGGGKVERDRDLWK
jgi:hypothetical protein